jgi:hypothetical protein
MMIGGVYLEFCWERLVLSRWPRPMLDDPKDLVTELLGLVVWVLLLSLLLAVPSLIVLVIRNWRKIINERQYLVRIGVFAAGLLAFWLLVHFDPGRVWYTFFD